MTDVRATVAAIVRYPVKSCAGHSVERAELDAYGIVGDRRWLIVDPDGEFLTQRDAPRLALLRPDLNEGGLTLSAPGVDTIDVPINTDGPTLDVRVWNDRCRGVDQGDDAAAWLSDYLGASHRLVKMTSDFERPVDADYAVSADDAVSYADGFPFLLANTGSLDELNRRLASPVPMDRFRPNIVVSGAHPFEEDTWGSIRIGDVTFHVVKPCARCVVTTTDQTTGERGTEPLTTLASFRRDENGKVYFGRNLIHSPKHGEIAVGDAVTILDVGPSRPSLQAG